MTDNINPDHYKNKTIETIHAICSQLTEVEMVGYLRASIMKYIMRFGSKNGLTLDKSIEDTKKSKWFMDQLLLELESIKKSGSDSYKHSNVHSLFPKDKK
jgi:hypothetical protein